MRIKERREQRLHILHRALTERGITDDEPAAVILDRGGKDLRCGSRRAVDQHSERARPQGAGLAVDADFDIVGRVTHLHDRSLINEQAGELDRLVERAAAVVTQVHDHAGHTFALELRDQSGDIARCGYIILRATACTEILIEARQFDHADFLRSLTFDCRNLDDVGLGDTVFEFDLVAHQRHQLGLRVERCFGRDHAQAHGGALFTANQLHDIINAPADHVFHRQRGSTGCALSHRHNAIAGLEHAALGYGAAGHDFADGDHIILFLQNGANAFERL